jgi:uncharacterized protein (TIGR04255 family)
VGPPIVELIIGIQFAPLVNATSGHFGCFWREHLQEWRLFADVEPIADQFESFESPIIPSANELMIVQAPYPGRLQIVSDDEAKMIQIQQSRFLLNWRSRGSAYPTFSRVFDDFQTNLGKFRSFINQSGFGELIPNQWELTYVDAFRKGDYWETLDDWPNVLPGLLSKINIGVDSMMTNRNAAWKFDLPKKFGRLHFNMNHARLKNNDNSNTTKFSDAIILNSTIRGPIQQFDVLETTIRSAKQTLSEAFRNIVSKEVTESCQ